MGLEADSINKYYRELVIFFQYMIGNKDMNMHIEHNVRFLEGEKHEKKIPIPYDFDFSGLVSAPYASPSAESGVLTVRDRFLMAQGINEQSIRKARNKFLAEKPTLYAWCRNSNLSSESSAQMTAFLDAFFQAVEADESVPLKLNYTKKE